MAQIRNIQSATDDLVIGVDPAWINAPLDAPFQALSNNDWSNLWWTIEDVSGHDGYFWLHNAETAGVIGINTQGGIRSGSQLQSQTQAHEASQWWTTVKVPNKPGYFWLMSAASNLVIDIDNSGGIRSGSQLQVLDRKSEDNQWWRWVEVPSVAAPALGSDHNYFLFGGYDEATGFLPLNEVVVTITITEDLIGTPQFSFQLNCWSPNPTMQEQRTDGKLYDVWQQYGLSGAPGSNQATSFAESWQANGDLLCKIEPPGFWSLSNNGKTMVAGTEIMIILSQLDGVTGPISGSMVVAADGNEAKEQEITIIGAKLATGGNATAKDLSSIAAMQMNIVAWGTPAGAKVDTRTVFASGAGTIQYFSSTPMTVRTSPPSDVAVPTWITGETSNSTYGELPKGTSKLFLQTFGHST